MGVKLGKDGNQFLKCLRRALDEPDDGPPWSPRIARKFLEREADAPGFAALFGVQDDGTPVIDSRGIARLTYGMHPLTVPAAAAYGPLVDPTWRDSFWDCIGPLQRPRPTGDPAVILASDDVYAKGAREAAPVIFYCETRLSRGGGSIGAMITELLAFLGAAGFAAWKG